MKRLSMILVLALVIGLLSGCTKAQKETTGKTVAVAEKESKEVSEETDTSEAAAPEEVSIEKLSVAFVPSRDPGEIVTVTEPLKELLKGELKNFGYNVGEVEITVGTSYEAVGEALSAGTADVGLVPGGTYVMYDDGAEVILTATRDSLSKDSDNAKDWNDGLPTEVSSEQAVSYRALVIAGPSQKGQELATKVNNGEELTWEDLNSANWSVMSTTSPAGYIYPTIWLQDNYGKSITDLSNVVTADSYGSAMARLASGQIDIMVSYADVRRDNEEKWTTEFGRTESIWKETNVIGVTPAIYNDTVSVSKNSEIMTDELKTALQQAFINIGKTDEGKQVISVYSHMGYQVAKDSDYNNERKAQEIVQNMGN